LAGALWEQIRACWDQEPKERPTISKALETLLVLGETYQQGTVVSLGDPDDEIMIGEWEQVDGFEEGTFIGLGVTQGLTFRWYTQRFRHTRNARRMTKSNTS